MIFDQIRLRGSPASCASLADGFNLSFISIGHPKTSPSDLPPCRGPCHNSTTTSAYSLLSLSLLCIRWTHPGKWTLVFPVQSLPAPWSDCCSYPGSVSPHSWSCGRGSWWCPSTWSQTSSSPQRFQHWSQNQARLFRASWRFLQFCRISLFFLSPVILHLAWSAHQLPGFIWTGFFTHLNWDFFLHCFLHLVWHTLTCHHRKNMSQIFATKQLVVARLLIFTTN